MCILFLTTNSHLKLLLISNCHSEENRMWSEQLRRVGRSLPKLLLTQGDHIWKTRTSCSTIDIASLTFSESSVYSSSAMCLHKQMKANGVNFPSLTIILFFIVVWPCSYNWLHDQFKEFRHSSSTSGNKIRALNASRLTPLRFS